MANWYLGTTKWSAITIWAANTAYNVGDIRRQTAALNTLTVGNERAFRCTTAGTSDASEPTWILTEGSTTNDNTVVWTEVTGLETYGWGAAHARLTNAFSWAAAGDTIWLSNNSAETRASAMTLTSPGTAASICKVLCVNDSAEPPITLESTAIITTTGGGNGFSFIGFTYFYGVKFNAGTTTASVNINISSSLPWFITFDTCELNLVGSGANGRIAVGLVTSEADDNKCVFKNCLFSFSSTGLGITPNCIIDFIGGGLSSEGTLLTTVYKSVTASKGIVHFNGFDFSAYGSGKSLIQANLNAQTKFFLSNCKLGSSVAILSGSILGQGGIEVFLDNCDSGDPSSGPRSEAYTYQGYVVTNTAIVRSGGASDGTAYSLKMTANTTGVSFISPLVTRPIPKAISTVGSEITVTAHIAMEEGATPLTESKCWMEVEYMGTAGSTLTSFITDHNSTLLAESSTDQTTSTETWTGFVGTPVKQKLACTFTPEEKGFYMVRIYLARAFVTTTSPVVYVCPKLVIS